MSFKEDFREYWRTWLGITGMVVVLALLALQMESTRRQSQRNYDGIQCLVVQLQHHRYNSYIADNQIREKLDLEFEPPTAPRELLRKDLAERCERYLGDIYIPVEDGDPFTANGHEGGG